MNKGQRSEFTIFQRVAEQDSSESSLGYLFQEVSKLETSLQRGLLGTKSLSDWLKDSQAENVERPQTSNNSYEHEDSVVSGKVEIAVESPPGGPWTALNLINLQCKRLMDHGEDKADSRLFPIVHDVPSACKSGTGTNARVSTCVMPVGNEQDNCFSSKPKKDLTCHEPPQMADKDAAEEEALASSRKSKTQPELNGDMLEGSDGSSSAEHGHESILSSDNVKRFCSALPLDHNANLVLGRHSPVKPADGVMPSKSIEKKLQRSPTSTVTSHLRSKEVNETPATQHLRGTKRARKQPNPSRSGDIHDPHFQGVTFRMHAKMNDSGEQCRLCVTCKYSKKLRKRRRRRTPSNSDGESEPTASRGKICASCLTRKTPLWRDAEDGTPLCNACGIRYKKYRVHCVYCWHVPKKTSNSSSTCLKCGNRVRLTSAQRKHTT
ncbi:GATA-type zinc finger protein 1 [Syngnathus scovelli]|uniref:GATA-type zinc finger protein 1 n=1 Tax=Syngnathus scovelli TaxID=161590 RepID=UPI00210F8964|nr:GATA-type zinc finger protein 1 [Syngnathus scovelli]